MTAKEVLQKIEKQREEAGIAFLGHIYLEVPEYQKVTESLEMRIAKKPLNKTSEYDGDYGECPCCGKSVTDYKNYNVCTGCGQALDWK